MKNMHAQTLFVTLLLLVSATSVSCSLKSLTAGKQASERAVAQIHKQLDEERYGEIYTGAHEEFRKTSKEPDAIALFEAVHRKLGLLKVSNLSGFYVNATTGGTFVTLNYNTDFTEGSAAERFVFKMDGEKAVLCR
jgi:hypothetical protein